MGRNPLRSYRPRVFESPGPPIASVPLLLPNDQKAEKIMKLLIFAGLVALCVGSAIAAKLKRDNKVVCFWDSTSVLRSGPGRFTIEHLKQALPHCTHLVYGFAGINAADNKAIYLHPDIDIGARYSLFPLMSELKRTFVGLKIYLSIGGDADPYEATHKYLTVTETPEARSKFIKSAFDMCTAHGFDGIDLAWQFPTIKVHKQGVTFGSIWHKFKKTFGYDNFKDEKETKHRDGFTALVHDLNAELKTRNLALTLSVLPHVNASVYYNARKLARDIDAVHLMSFDQKTPDRDPEKADHPAPTYERYGNPSSANVDSAVRYWLDRETPPSKIVVGIPAFGRTWRLYDKSAMSGVPEINANGPGSEGPLTKTPGMLSYGEVCARLTEKSPSQVRRIGDPTRRYGSYAYNSYDLYNKVYGIWIGYDDPETVGNKASYVKDKGLGGIAIFDLSTDDFLGTCTKEAFPIVRAVKSKL